MACSPSHNNNAWNLTIDLFVKPKECSCGCHNLQVEQELNFALLFEPKEKYQIDNQAPFAERAKAYIEGEGKRLDAYLEGKGRSAYELAGVGTTNLETAVAAALITNDKAYILGDTHFDKKIEQLARHYNMPKEWVERYILDHENTHRWQKGEYLKNERAAERDVEKTVYDYYTSLKDADPAHADMYDALAGIAGDRFESVDQNYAPAPDYSSVGESIAA